MPLFEVEIDLPDHILKAYKPIAIRPSKRGEYWWDEGDNVVLHTSEFTGSLLNIILEPLIPEVLFFDPRDPEKLFTEDGPGRVRFSKDQPVENGINVWEWHHGTGVSFVIPEGEVWQYDTGVGGRTAELGESLLSYWKEWRYRRVK